MDFFNSLSQIAKNKDNFKKWEADQKDELAKREALYNSRQYSDEEIARAKALGENIIDVVDIMDNHSESVAENVETATQPMVATAPWLALFGSGALGYKFLFKKNFQAIDDITTKLSQNEEAKELCKKIEELNHKNGNHFYFGTWDLTHKKRIEKITDSNLREEAMKFYREYNKDIAKYMRSNKMGFLAVAAATLLSFVGINIYAAKLQVDSSKIARYQARESLKDPKAFVEYTPEQIAKAKEEIAKHPEWLKNKKKEKLKTGLFKSIINLFKDRKAYKKSVENDTDESKIVTRDLTPEEIANAQRDKEVIQRSVRIINNEAEKYSQRMEVAGDVLINGTPFLGAAIGGALTFVLNKLGIIDKIVDKNVSKNASEKTKELYESLKKGKESGKPVNKKWFEFRQSFMNDLHDSKSKTKDVQSEVVNNVKKSRKRSADFVPEIKRSFTTAMAHPKGRGWLIAGVGTIITGIAGALIGLKLQKSASRAGRYTAKRELEKDPRNFIGYTEDDYNEVKDVKSNKKSSSSFKEIAMFLPTVIKQYYEYDKFKKNEFKQKQLLQEQLQKQDVSDEQLRNAKNLQRKVFNTFEKVDDNSQTYSEATEAAIDIARPFVWYGGILTALSPFIIAGVQIYRGKLSPATVMNKITGFFSKSSNAMKSKWFKKYLGNVEKNVSKKVQNTPVEAKPLGVLLNGVDLNKDSITQILSKSWKNFKGSTKEFAKMSDKEQQDALWQLENSLTKSIRIKDPKLANKVSNIFSAMRWCTDSPQCRADALDLILNPSSIKSMSKERYDEAYKLAKNVISNGIGYENMERILYSRIDKALERVNIEQLKSVIEGVNKVPEIQGAINVERVQELIKTIENAKSYGSEPYIRDILSHENSVHALEAIEKLRNKINSLPELLASHPELRQYSEKLKDIVSVDIDDAMLPLLKQIGVKLEPNQSTITIADLQRIRKIYESKKIKDLLKLIPQEYKEPKAALDIFKKHVESMSEDEFAQLAERINFSSMDKKTMLEIIPKVQKMFDNIPKEEMIKIWNKCVAEFNEHPDEFLKLLASGKIGSIFMTPGLKTTLSAVGISWTVFTLGMTYLVSSWLGELQLKAGRLGVMKAMEGLEDPRYYANIEPVQTPVNTKNNNTVQAVTTENKEIPESAGTSANGNLLDKFKK